MSHLFSTVMVLFLLGLFPFSLKVRWLLVPFVILGVNLRLFGLFSLSDLLYGFMGSLSLFSLFFCILVIFDRFIGFLGSDFYLSKLGAGIYMIFCAGVLLSLLGVLPFELYYLPSLFSILILAGMGLVIFFIHSTLGYIFLLSFLGYIFDFFGYVNIFDYFFDPLIFLIFGIYLFSSLLIRNSNVHEGGG